MTMTQRACSRARLSTSNPQPTQRWTLSAGPGEIEPRPVMKLRTELRWRRERIYYSSQMRRSGDVEGSLEPIAKDLGNTVAPVLAVYESTFKDACVMEWTLEGGDDGELTARLQLIALG